MSFLNYFKCINTQHRELLVNSKMGGELLHTRLITQLTLVAGAFFSIAAIGYALQGYHFAFHTINQLSHSIPEALLHNITVFGDGLLLLPLILLFANRKPQLHWVIFLTAIIGGIISNVSKEYFDALRPPAVLDPESFNLFGKGYKHHSFPSGHTLTAFLMASVLYYFADKTWQKVAVISAAMLVGLSRIWLGVHWPIDTLVGAGLGIICGISGIWLATKWQSAINPTTHKCVLFLFLVAAILALVEKNDYILALPLLYLVAIAALWVSLKNYFLVPFETQRSPLESDYIKLPYIGTWANAQTLFWVATGVLFCYRILVLFQPHFSLFYDEAYYYHWSLIPDLGYYSKPPMVAWCILLSTSLFGSGVIAIKLMASVLYSASSVVIFYTLKRYSTSSIAFIGAMVFITIPMVGFNSEFITTDAPLFFFWCLSLYFVLRAIEDNKLGSWLLVGIFTGCGMLAKYTMGALPLAVFLFLLTNKNQRPLLATLGPWLAAIIAGLVFSLNIYWNFANNWVALQHTKEISQTSGDLFNIQSLIEFLISQWVIFGPLSSYLLYRAVKAFYLRDKKAVKLPVNISSDVFKLLLWVMAVILVAISIQALLSRAFPNWAGPWMIGGTLLLAFGWQYAFSAKRFYVLLGRSLAVNLLLLSLFYHWPLFLRWIDIEPSSKNDPFQRVASWPQLGEQLKPVMVENSNALLVSDSRDLLAYLGYFAMPNEFRFARWNANPNNIRDYYDLEVNLRNWQGNTQQEFIFVSRKPLTENILKHFKNRETLPNLSYSAYVGESKVVYVYHLTGFKGYSDE